MAVRGPPKKKQKTTNQTSIVPFDGDEVPASSMSFPPSNNLESMTVKAARSAKSESAGSKRSRSGSNQPMSSDQTIAPVKRKAKRKRKQPAKKPDQTKGKNRMISFDSPAISTRSKKNGDPASPAMSTRSKRRLSM
ncbi:unnamed protein product [Urochloa humidicola]